MIGRRRLTLSRSLILPATGLVLVLTACGGSIESSPFRKQFNAALDSCEDVSSPDERGDCFNQAMEEYTGKYERWLKTQPPKR